MPFEESAFIWKNGELVPWAECTTHVMSHSLHYGSAVFESVRCYCDDAGTSRLFRMGDHLKHLLRSVKICMIDVPYTADELAGAIVETIKANELSACYVRPIVYYGYSNLDINPGNAPVEVAIAAWPREACLGAADQGIAVGVSSWRQRSNNAIPPQMKSSASYMNSILAKQDAELQGYDEAIMLNEQGLVCEGTGENLFIVRDGVLSTPPVSDGLLEGVTRDTVLNLAMDLEIPVIEESLARADLYTADEMFLTGTAAEITPVLSVDGRAIGERGPLTKAIQERFFAATSGKLPEYSDWLFEVK